MDIVSSAWHVIVAFLLFCFGAVAVSLLGKRFKLSLIRSLVIYLWHSFFCVFFLWYALSYGADAVSYYQKAVIGQVTLDFGTAGVDYLTMLLVHGLGVSILGAFLVYNIFGSVGLIALDGTLRIGVQDARPYVKKLATIIVFLPSLSFWSSAIGKDALSFMASGLALWAALELGRRGWLMIVAILIMLLVRPHMAGLMVLALAFSVIFDSKVYLIKRFVYLISALAVAVVLVPFALEYAGVGDTVSVESLDNYVDRRQMYNQQGGGGVDISSMSLPMQLFTYMFRPTFFEINSLFSIAAAIDNIILLYLFAIGGWALLKSRVKGSGNRLFMWAYVLMSWVILSMVTANLGIALRQKWMFAPMLIFLLISVIGKKKHLTITTSSNSGSSENTGGTGS